MKLFYMLNMKSSRYVDFLDCRNPSHRGQEVLGAARFLSNAASKLFGTLLGSSQVLSLLL